MSKRLLMIADADGIWTRHFIENVALPGSFEVTLFPIWGDKGTLADFYRQSGVTVYHDAHRLPVVRHIPRLRMWARVWLNARALRALGPFDAVYQQYLSQRDLALGYLVAKRFRARWVCCFIGSDLLRSSSREKRRMARLLRHCDHVVAWNKPAVADAFGAELDQKTVQLDFGHNSCRYIDDARRENTKADCKRHFGIDPDTTAVCLGYNASPAQQHLAAMQAMRACGRLGDVTLVLQLNYGDSEPGYVDRVLALARTLPCRVVTLTDFMDGPELALLRLAADIYVHPIKTDAFAVSLQEFLYAGATVLMGAWLPYPELAQMGIAPARFADFNALPPLLDRALAGELTPITDEQRALFPKLYGWDALRERWLALLG